MTDNSDNNLKQNGKLKKIEITKQFLKSRSGEFDLESIHSICLKNCEISDLGCLGECSGLEKLDLSFNNLTRLYALSSLINLQYLNLSANRISSLEGLQALDNLRYLNLSGNLINSLSTIKSLCYMEKLTDLIMFDKAKDLTNPICLNNSYKKEVQEILLNLISLDGERIRGRGSEFFSLSKELDSLLEQRESLYDNNNLQKEKTNSVTSHNQIQLQWPDLSLSLSNNLLFDAESDLESLLKQCKVVKEKAELSISQI